ncbi:unnamed protein product [Linum tenue]|uniref:Uncharacterized protein n=1 Tax=Linum tenue TaxID=586396 RepID=A0AAV0JDP3_9ROSI|nr:unnamed protein product [Linum tenue]
MGAALGQHKQRQCLHCRGCSASHDLRCWTRCQHGFGRWCHSC